MTNKTNDHPPRYPLPDPADRPLLEAAKSLAMCTDTKTDPSGQATMMRELRAAIGEFGPGGQYRTPDIRLAAQMAVLDTMFYLNVQRAVRHDRVEVQVPTKDNGYKSKFENGDVYLDEDRTMLALRIQNQYRRIIEGLKLSEDRHVRTRLTAMRLADAGKFKK